MPKPEFTAEQIRTAIDALPADDHRRPIIEQYLTDRANGVDTSDDLVLMA
jgi:hypothetical protein